MPDHPCSTSKVHASVGILAHDAEGRSRRHLAQVLNISDMKWYKEFWRCGCGHGRIVLVGVEEEEPYATNLGGRRSLRP
jgi:hypothetical protein